MDIDAERLRTEAEILREEQERLRQSQESSRVAAELIRIVAEQRRLAIASEINGTVATFTTLLERMEAVEQKRRAARGTDFSD